MALAASEMVWFVRYEYSFNQLLPDDLQKMGHIRGDRETVGNK
jgi:hypothetical protein